MVKAGFSEEMKEILSQMKGKTFKSYEGTIEEKWNRVFGNVRLNLGKYAVDLSSELYSIPYLDSVEDISCFSCQKQDLKSKFTPYVDDIVVAHMVDEVIEKVIVITDQIKINDSYEISVDQALVVVTDKRNYSFYKKWFMDEEISIKISEGEYGVRPVEAVKEDWSDEGEYSVHVERAIVEL